MNQLLLHDVWVRERGELEGKLRWKKKRRREKMLSGGAEEMQKAGKGGLGKGGQCGGWESNC